MRIDENTGIIEQRRVFFPCYKLTITTVPQLIPNDIDRELVFQRAFFILFLTTLILSKCHVCITGNVCRVLHGTVCLQQSFTSTEYFTGKVTCIEINIGIAINNGKISSTENITINIRRQFGQTLKINVGITGNLTYEFRTLSLFIIFSICFTVQTFLSSVTSGKD